MLVVHNIHILELGIGFLAINNGLLIIYGKNHTESDGTARITLPISFMSAGYGAAALHAGSDFCDLHIDYAYKLINFLPIKTRNANNNAVGKGWCIFYICIGY